MIEQFIFTSALKDFFRPKRIGLWVLIVFVLALITVLISRVSPDATPEKTYLQMSSIIVYRVLALAAAIFATAVVSAEVEQKTIVYLLTRPIPRWKLIVFRSLAAAVVVFLVGVASGLAVSFAAHGAGGLNNEYLTRDLVGFAVGALAYVGFFTLLSLIINRSMIVSLLYAFGWETIVPNMPGDVRVLSISNYLQVIAERPSLGQEGQGAVGALAGQLSVNTMTPGTAWPVIMTVIIFCFAFGAWWFNTFEYLPREDVE